MIILYFDYPRYTFALRSRGFNILDPNFKFCYWDSDLWPGLTTATRIQYSEGSTQQTMRQNAIFVEWMKTGYVNEEQRRAMLNTNILETRQIGESPLPPNSQLLEVTSSPSTPTSNRKSLQPPVLLPSPEVSELEYDDVKSLSSDTATSKPDGDTKQQLKRGRKLVCGRCKIKKRPGCDKKTPCNHCAGESVAHECEARYREFLPKERTKRVRKQKRGQHDMTDDVYWPKRDDAIKDTVDNTLSNDSTSNQIQHMENFIRKSRGQSSSSPNIAMVRGSVVSPIERDDVPVITHCKPPKQNFSSGMSTQLPLPTFDPSTMSNQQWLQAHNVS